MTLRSITITAAVVCCLSCGSQDMERPMVRITIPRGATLTAVAESLAVHQIIASPRRFRWYATLSGKQRAIQAGTYDFPAPASIRQALAILVSGREVLLPLGLPEGLMATEVVALIQQQLGIDAESLVVAIGDSSLRARVGTPGATLEGYLYPSTYYVRQAATAREVVQQLVREFEAQWKPSWNARLDSLAMSRHEAVILASIIEGEVRYAPDRKYVSSVYHNRLTRGMRLQADPTVIYALGHRRRLFQRDYRTESPYNTYRINGLPPGPITQPSAASIEAALYPARSDFLFFVAQPDGKHVFSRTLREHNRAIQRVRQSEARLGLR